MLRQILFALLLGVPAGGLQAQARPFSPAPSPLFALARTSAPRDTTATPNPPSTYWKEGAIAGGVAVGLFGAMVAGGLCSGFDGGHGGCNGALLGGLLMGGVVGGTIGALIGGQFPK
jgi:hypothetical protein